MFAVAVDDSPLGPGVTPGDDAELSCVGLLLFEVSGRVVVRVLVVVEGAGENWLKRARLSVSICSLAMGLPRS